MLDDNLWDNLYWNSELTRTDRLTKILSSIIQKDNYSDDFIYNHRIAKDAMENRSTTHVISPENAVHTQSKGGRKSSSSIL